MFTELGEVFCPSKEDGASGSPPNSLYVSKCGLIVALFKKAKVTARLFSKSQTSYEIERDEVSLQGSSVLRKLLLTISRLFDCPQGRVEDEYRLK